MPFILIYLALGALLLVVRGPFKNWWLRRQFKKRPDQQKGVRYRFDEEGFEAETEGLASARLQWAIFQRALVGQRDLLLFQTARIYQYVPLDVLEPPARERLVALVRSHVPA